MDTNRAPLKSGAILNTSPSAQEVGVISKCVDIHVRVTVSFLALLVVLRMGDDGR